MKIKRKKVQLREFYDVDEDILNFYWGNKTEHSRELNVTILVDFDKKDNIVGIEIYDFFSAIKEGQKIIDKIFKIANKNIKESKKK